MILTKKILAAVLISGACAAPLRAQYTTHNGHSHNDYRNEVPFRLAYDHHFGSIEADIWVVNGELLVAHDEAQVTPERSINSLYLDPIVKLFRENGGTPWKDDAASFQLLVDLKSPTEPTLSRLVDKLAAYREVFDQSVNPRAVRVIITGNGPAPADYGKYPSFVFFDGAPGKTYNRNQLERVGLYSVDFKKFSSWDGVGEITADDRARIKELIDKAHGMKKKIRFWDAPDNPKAWAFFKEMRSDFINTDRIADLAAYLSAR